MSEQLPGPAADHGPEAEPPTALESVKAKLADTMREPGLATLSNGLHALAAAGFEGDEQAVGILLGCGKEDVDEGSPDAGYTAASMAAFKGELGCLKLLAEHGADLSKANRDGATAVWQAAAQSHVDCLRFLQAHGCDLSTPDNDGSTPAYIAAHEGHAELISFCHAVLMLCLHSAARPLFKWHRLGATQPALICFSAALAAPPRELVQGDDRDVMCYPFEAC